MTQHKTTYTEFLPHKILCYGLYKTEKLSKGKKIMFI